MVVGVQKGGKKGKPNELVLAEMSALLWNNAQDHEFHWSNFFTTLSGTSYLAPVLKPVQRL